MAVVIDRVRAARDKGGESKGDKGGEGKGNEGSKGGKGKRARARADKG
jgi:hypothetical protein